MKMKKIRETLNLLTTAIIGIMLITSCGGGKKESVIAKVKPDKVEISGDLSDYLQVVDNEYEITDDWGGNLSIKVKAIKPMSAEELKGNDFDLSASLLGDNGMPVSGTGEFTVEYASKDKLLSLLKKGSGEEVIQLKAQLGSYKAEEHADKSKKFSVSSTMKAKEKQTTSTTENSDNTSATTEETATTSSSDCDQFITDYEDFVNNYIKIIKKMKANPSDMSIMTEYTEMASKAATMQTDAANCTDAKYASKLLKLASKMASAAYGM